MNLIRITILAACFILVGTVEARATVPPQHETIAVRLAPGVVVTRDSVRRFGVTESVYPIITVDGKEITQVGSGAVADFAGRGVIVRFASSRGVGPAHLSMVSVRKHAVRVVIALWWKP